LRPRKAVDVAAVAAVVVVVVAAVVRFQTIRRRLDGTPLNVNEKVNSRSGKF
jgi:hypothetical protein